MGTIREKNFDNRSVTNRRLGDSFGASHPVSAKRNYIYEDFKYNITATKYLGLAPTGATGDRNLFKTRMNIFEYHIKGTQDILAPVLTTAGLDISLDQTDNDGIEITNGILSRCPVAMTIGTTGAMSFRVKFKITDVSGTDDCAIGFRKAEAYQANFDDYNDAAVLNVILGAIKIETIAANAATTTTDTTNTWADAATHTLQVNVAASGAVTYLIDSAAPSTTATFSFANADVIVPFFFFLQATTSPGIVELLEWECGLQSE